MQTSALKIHADDLFQLLGSCMHVGCWTLNLYTSDAWLSDEFLALLGLQNMPQCLTLDTMLANMVHAGDRDKLQALLSQCRAIPDQPQQKEIKLLHADGRYHCYKVHAVAKPAQHHKPAIIAGSIIKADKNNLAGRETEGKVVLLDTAEEMTGIGLWEYNYVTGESYWSRMVYDILGVPPGEVDPWHKVFDYFEQRDKERLAEAISQLPQKKEYFDLELQLSPAAGRQSWVRLTGKPVLNDKKEVTGIRGIFQNIDLQKSKEFLLMEINNKIAAHNFVFDEACKMASVGGWEVDLVKNTVIWSEQTKRIHEVYNDYKPTVDKAINFFYGASKAVMIDKYNRLINDAEPYDVELEFLTARKRKIWVRSVGRPVLDEGGKVIGVRGVFQDIDEQKRRELALEASLVLINKQNDKLKDFAYIVSHNLRSHTGNLKMITNMIDLETEPAMKLEWLDHIKGLSDSLDETVNNLKEIANSTISIQDSKKPISFKEVYQHVVNVLPLKTNEKSVRLHVDFSECEYIDYVPAYLESIMLNLMTNAIKYKHPYRQSEIFIKSYFEDNRPCLKVSDNGLGIDLKRYGHRIFKMNETFHNNADARGIGLYITKSQIEKLGGGIEVDSEVDKGTTFKIKF